MFEAASRVGGNCTTLCRDGFRFDTGAHRFHDRDPEITEEVRRLLGVEARFLDEVRRLVGPELTVRVTCVLPGELARDGSGKTRVVISHVKAGLPTE